MLSWIPETQRCAATSTTKAEYIAMADLVKSALFVRDILTFIVPIMEGKCNNMREDIEGAVVLGNNPLSSVRSRYIDVRFHFSGEKCYKLVVANRELQVRVGIA